MRILINFSTCKVGGAQNVALNALQVLSEVQIGSGLDVVLLVPTRSAVEQKAFTEGFETFGLSRNPIIRSIQEFFLIWVVHTRRPLDVVYNYWHYIPLMPCFCVQNSADSNIYFPEIRFWNNYKGMKAWGKKLKDVYRLYGARSSDLVFVENKAIYQRLVEQKTHGEVRYIAPSVDLLEMNLIPKRVRIFGVLSGWQRNKNIDILPYLAKEIKSLGVRVEFHLSLDEDSNDSYAHDIYEMIDSLNVRDMFKFKGTIDKDDIPSFYASVDAIMLLSNLESFSNNIAESWAFSRPIILQDVEWARYVCDSSGFYIGLENIEKEVLRLMAFCDNQDEIMSRVMQGRKMLHSLNSHRKKLQIEIDYIQCLRAS